MFSTAVLTALRSTGAARSVSTVGKVKHCLKPSAKLRISENASVFDAVIEFEKHDTGCLLLTSPDDPVQITGNETSAAASPSPCQQRTNAFLHLRI